MLKWFNECNAIDYLDNLTLPPLSLLQSHIVPYPHKNGLPQQMVTPTPSAKRQKMSSVGDYSRKNKSLGVLADTFCQKHAESPKGTVIILDLIAKDFGVERRRIYDVVNILEAVKIVVKKGKVLVFSA